MTDTRSIPPLLPHSHDKLMGWVDNPAEAPSGIHMAHRMELQLLSDHSAASPLPVTPKHVMLSHSSAYAATPNTPNESLIGFQDPALVPLLTQSLLWPASLCTLSSYASLLKSFAQCPLFPSRTQAPGSLRTRVMLSVI
jgi:hypothetical protein